MPKLKTKKGLVKRVKLTKKGKVKYPACGKSHLLSSKNSKRLRRLRRRRIVAGKKDIKYIKRMLPYG
ncbi:MAG: 50S ribosomal protein L35 [Candidatus Omnitrophica bacterium]|nr:50S ribosomal protein L35 [Candidatus Omnitrophota bacterium]MDD5552483.1 50S ribosomal protein L35 [Candidatus Omnitrophota bacterium]